MDEVRNKNAISFVLPHQLRGVMQDLLPLLERVVRPETGYSIQGVLSDLANGNTLLWVINDWDAITITRLQLRDTGPVLWNEWLAGDPGVDMATWVGDWLDAQEEYARKLNCVAVEFAGRIGYKRKFRQYYKDRDFKAIRTIYRQEL